MEDGNAICPERVEHPCEVGRVALEIFLPKVLVVAEEVLEGGVGLENGDAPRADPEDGAHFSRPVSGGEQLRDGVVLVAEFLDRRGLDPLLRSAKEEKVFEGQITEDLDRERALRAAPAQVELEGAGRLTQS